MQSPRRYPALIVPVYGYGVNRLAFLFFLLC